MSNQVKFMVKMNEGDNKGPSLPRKKKPYKKPELIDYGNVAQLTAGNNGSNMDPGGNMTKNGPGRFPF